MSQSKKQNKPLKPLQLLDVSIKASEAEAKLSQLFSLLDGLDIDLPVKANLSKLASSLGEVRRDFVQAYFRSRTEQRSKTIVPKSNNKPFKYNK